MPMLEGICSPSKFTQPKENVDRQEAPQDSLCDTFKSSMHCKVKMFKGGISGASVAAVHWILSTLRIFLYICSSSSPRSSCIWISKLVPDK